MMTDRLTVAHIRAIWHRHGLGEVWSIEHPAGGARNSVVYVNGEMVLRANTLDIDDPKFRNEAIAYRLLSQSSLPIPHVLVLDESREIVPFDVMTTSRLTGDSLAETWRSLDPETLDTLIVESGALLARIHALTFLTFGKLRDLESRPFSAWFDYFSDYAHRYLTAARQMSLIDVELNRRLSEALEQSRPLYNESSPAHWSTRTSTSRTFCSITAKSAGCSTSNGPFPAIPHTTS